MNPWLLLFPVFLALATGAVCTYHKPIRDSSYYLPVFIGMSLLTGWLWVLASRRLDDPVRIMVFSLVWDFLMAAAYYAGPMVVKGEKLGWQAWAAAAVTVGGIAWFKLATGK